MFPSDSNGNDHKNRLDSIVGDVEGNAVPFVGDADGASDGDVDGLTVGDMDGDPKSRVSYH